MPVACDLVPVRQSSAKSKKLLIVDASVEDSATLLSGLQEGTQVIFADKYRLHDLIEVLETHGQVDELHILTHGAPGKLSLGGDLFDGASIVASHPLSGAMKAVAGEGSKIALWACNVAKSGVGKSFVDALSNITGAIVYASENPIGAKTKGGTWDIGVAAPFSLQAQAAYPHTLPAFDFTGASGNGTNTVTETESGVTMTITISPSANWVVADGGGLQGSTADIAAIGASNISYTVTFSFNTAIDIEDFFYFEGDNDTSGTSSWVFTVTGGSGTTLTFTSGDFNGQNALTVDPTDWTNVTSFTVTATGTAGFQPAFDTINFSLPVANTAPDLGGTPADDGATEDVATAIDLSAYNISDADNDDPITITLAVDRGTIASVDGNGTFGSVTIANSGTTSMTLSGSAANLNTYLNDTSHITFTTDQDDTTTATLTVTPNDGTEDGTADTVSITISSVNDDPEISGLVTDIGFTEDTAGNVNLSASTISDVDESGTMTVTITASEGTFGTPASGAGNSVTETRVSDTVITLVGTAANINTYLDTASNITWTPAENDNGGDTSTFTITANDGEGSGDVSLGTVNADVTAVNDDPTATGIPTDITVTEETASNVDLSGIDFTDVDSAGTVFVTLTASEGTLTSSTAGGVSVSGSGTTTLTLEGTFAAIETFLDTTNAVRYTGATDDTGSNAATLSIAANDDDGSGDVALGTVNFDITNVNDDPEVSGLPTDIGFTEDTQGNLSLSTVTLSDVDSSSVTVTITASEGTFASPADGSGVGSGVTASGNDDTITLVGAPADINTYLDTASNIQWTPAENDNGNDTSTFTVTANDGDGSGNVALGTINADVTAVNDDPTATGGPTDITVTEETQSNVDLSSVDFSDVDSAGTVFVTLTASEGTLTAAGGITTSGSGTASVTISGTFAAIETYLNTANAITYTGATNDSGDNAATLTVAANDDDGSGDVTLFTTNFDITDVNDDPTVSSLPSSVTVTEDTQSNVDLGAADFEDVDGNDITVTLTVSSGTFASPADGSGVGAGVTASGNDDTITLVGAPDDIDAYLDTASNIQYTPASNASGSSVANITVTANDGNGSGNVSLGNVDIDVTAVNDAPEFTGLDGTPSFTEGGSAVVLDADVTVADFELDSIDDFSGATLVIVRNGGANAADTFSIQSGGNLTVAGSNISSGGNVIASFDTASVSGQVTISFADNGTTPTGALVDEILQAIRYSNSSNDPSASVQLDWTFSDGNSADAQGTGDNPGTDTGSTTVTVTNVSDAPTLTATGGNPTHIEDAGASDLFNTVSASTVEAADRINSMTLTVTNVNDGADEILSFDGSDLSLADGTNIVTATNSLSVSVSVVGTTATVSFSGASLTSAQFQTLIDGLTYRNSSDDPTTAGNRVVTVTGITDDGSTAGGGANSAAPNITSTVTVTAVNDEPSITGVFADNSTDIIAGTGASDVTAFNDAAVSDDTDDFNGGFITISQTAGTANGSWGVDGTNVTSGGDATVSAGETIQVNGVTIGTVDVTDDGQGGNDFTITFTTTSANADTVEDLLQNLTYDGPSGIDTRSFTLTLNDNGGTANSGDEEVSGTFSLDVTPNPPAFTNLDGDSGVWNEGDGPLDLDSGGNATITDADSANFDGGDLEVSITANQAADDRLEIDISGSVSLSAGQTAGSTVSVSGTAIGTIQAGATGGSGEDLIINLNSDATPALVQTLVQELQYNNAGGDDPTDGDRTVTITVSDGDGATSANNDITIDVDPVEDAPTVSGLTDRGAAEDTAGALDFSAVTIADADTSGNITVTITAADTDAVLGAVDGSGVGAGVADTANGDNVVTLVGTAADITTYLSNASAITYTSSQDRETDDTISIQADDGVSTPNAASTATIVVTPINDLPTATDNTISMQEDTSYTFSASDFNFNDVDSGDALTSVRIDTLTVGSGTFQLSGVDVSATDVIAIADINAGNLVFTPAADDNGTDLLTLTFSVNDGTGFAAAPSNLAVNVQDVAENQAPTGFALSNNVVDENDEGAVIGTISATDPEGDDVTFSIAAGGDRFTITDGNVLRLQEGVSLDFESIVNGLVSVEILAVDESGSRATQIFTITVNDIIEGSDANDEISGSNDDEEVSSGNGDDEVNAGGGSDRVDGGAGNDDVSGGDGSDRVFGGNDDDTVAGGNGDDTVRGDDGDDRVAGGAGNDVAFAGPGDTGNDTVEGNDGDDTLGGGRGDDLVVGGDIGINVNDTNPGSCDDDVLFGGDGDDLIIGGSYNTQTDTVVNTGGGNNQLWGGAGDDRVFGDDGNDLIGGGAGDDSVQAGGGNDTLYGGRAGGDTSNDTLRGGNGDDLILSSIDDDVVFGEDGNDTLFGGAGDDTVNGGNGNDILWAGGGNDQLSGGTGADTFTFGNVSGNDTILDFAAGSDTLDLRFASTDFASVAEVQAASINTSQGGQSGVLIDIGDGDSVFVVGISITDLTASNVTV